MSDKIKKIGWLVSQMSPSQLCYQIIDSSNRYLRENDDVDIFLSWFNDGPRPIEPRFSCACAFDMFGYTGNSIATSIHTASRVLNYPGPSRNKMFYYLFDLCWLRLNPNQRQWDSLSQIYLNPKLNLIVRSQSHFDIVKSIWREPIAIIEDCNINKFKELIDE